MRAVAVVAVVAFHAAPGRLPGGFAGVDIFFVISGFLITSIIVRGIEADRFRFGEFYARRVRRIFPSLAVVLLASLAIGVGILTPSEMTDLSKHIAAGAAFVSNVVLWTEVGYFDQASEFKILLHLWSLGIEEQFYFVWPLILWISSRFNRSSYFFAALAICGVSFAANIVLTTTHPAAAFYLPLSRFWELSVGALLATQRANASGIPTVQPLRNVTAGAGAILVGLSIAFLDKSNAFPGWWACLPVLGAALLIWSGPTAFVNRNVLSQKVLVWVGLISFPLYLWHWPALALLRTLEGTEVAQWKRGIAVGASFLLAWATYWLVEARVRHSTRRGVTFALSAMVAALAVVGVAGAITGGFPARPFAPRVANAGDIGHAPFFESISRTSHRCTPESIASRAGSWEGHLRCFQSLEDATHDVVLLGDSHAEHLFPGVAESLPHLNVVFYGNGSGLPLINNDDYASIFAEIAGDGRIRTILLASNWSMKIGRDRSAWESDLRDTIRELSRRDVQVYLVEDLPRFGFLPSRCKYSGRAWIASQCEQASSGRDEYMNVFDEVAEEFDNVRVVRTYELLCADGVCSMARNGVLLFRDEDHLNIDGSTYVGEAIVRSMENRR